MSRKEFSAKVKDQAFKRSKGACEGCGRKLFTGDINYDHVNADGLTGEPVLGNCAVLCRSCHDLKTRTQDVPAIAQAKRRERAHLGIKRKPKGRPMPGGRNSPWRKKINGEVVRR